MFRRKTNVKEKEKNLEKDTKVRAPPTPPPPTPPSLPHTQSHPHSSSYSPSSMSSRLSDLFSSTTNTTTTTATHTRDQYHDRRLMATYRRVETCVSIIVCCCNAWISLWPSSHIHNRPHHTAEWCRWPRRAAEPNTMASFYSFFIWRVGGSEVTKRQLKMFCVILAVTWASPANSTSQSEFTLTVILFEFPRGSQPPLHCEKHLMAFKSEKNCYLRHRGAAVM